MHEPFEQGPALPQARDDVLRTVRCRPEENEVLVGCEQIQAMLLAAHTSGPEIFVQQAMTALSKRQVKTFFLYQHNNYGIEMFEKNFGAQGKEVGRFEGASVQFVPEFDRRLSYDPTLRMSGDMMVAFLVKSTPISRA